HRYCRDTQCHSPFRPEERTTSTETSVTTEPRCGRLRRERSAPAPCRQTGELSAETTDLPRKAHCDDCGTLLRPLVDHSCRDRARSAGCGELSAESRHTASSVPRSVRALP